LNEEIRILHVDDEGTFVETSASLLERENDRFSVETVTSAEEGLSELDEDGYDCVVSDHEMPGMDGIEFLREVRDDYSELPFILFTGQGSEEVASEAIGAGVTDYLQKEVGTDQYKILANRISNAVERARAEAEVRRSQERFEKFSEAFPDVAFYIDEDGRYLDVIAGKKSPLLYDEAEELIGNTFHETLPEETAEWFHKTVGEALETGELRSIEYTLDVQAGEKYFEARIVPIDAEISDNGTAIWVARDITDIKEIESELRESRERYRSLFKNNPSAIWEEDISDFITRLEELDEDVDDIEEYLVSNPDEMRHLIDEIEVIDVNQRALNRYGASSKEELLENMGEILTDTALKLLASVGSDFLEGKASYRGEIVTETFGGEIKHELLEIHVPEAYADDYSRVYVTTIDITEYKS